MNPNGREGVSSWALVVEGEGLVAQSWCYRYRSAERTGACWMQAETMGARTRHQKMSWQVSTSLTSCKGVA